MGGGSSRGKAWSYTISLSFRTKTWIQCNSFLQAVLWEIKIGIFLNWISLKTISLYSKCDKTLLLHFFVPLLFTHLGFPLVVLSLINGLCIKVPCSVLLNDTLAPLPLSDDEGEGGGLSALYASQRPRNRKCCRLTDALPNHPLNHIPLFAYYANELLKV